MASPIPRPNFFIVGAQKCGTTSLAMYLAEHPNAFLSNPKEPYYFSTDFPTLRRVTEENDYIRLFNDADPDSIAIGEATAGYLFSTEAIQGIYDFNRDAKIIVMLRPPFDLVKSFHTHQQFAFQEDEPDFSKAWALQETRLQGSHIPRQCIAPQFLHYSEVGRLGKQVELLCSIFPRSQIQFFLLEELASDPGAVYRQSLTFLNLPDDGRNSFIKFNEKKAHRFRWLFSIFEPRPRWFQAIIERVRSILGPTGWNRFQRFFIKKPKVSEVPDSLRKEIKELFREDIRLLAELTGKDLRSWQTDEQPDRPAANSD